MVYGDLYDVWGPLGCMRPFMVYGALYIATPVCQTGRKQSEWLYLSKLLRISAVKTL
jgi:hypothetical protein